MLMALVAWAQAQLGRFSGCLSVIGVVSVLVWLVWFGSQLVGYIPTDAMSFSSVSSVTATAEPTATAIATAEPSATKAAAAKPKPTKKPAPATAVPVQPTAVPTSVPAEPTSVPPAPTATTETHSIEGPQGPCMGGSRMINHFNQTFSLGSVDNYTYQIDIGSGMVALAWGSEIPGVGPGGRTFLTIAGPWKGAIGVSNGAVRIGYVLSSLKEVQETWSAVINCDIQRDVPDDQKKFDLYRWEKIGW